MESLISKDEQIKTSVVYVGYLILKDLKRHKDNKVSIFDLTEMLKKRNIIHYRQIIFALMFLHSCGIIDFKEPYIYKTISL
jgi:hypothetical protein